MADFSNDRLLAPISTPGLSASSLECFSPGAKVRLDRVIESLIDLADIAKSYAIANSLLNRLNDCPLAPPLEWLGDRNTIGQAGRLDCIGPGAESSLSRICQSNVSQSLDVLGLAVNVSLLDTGNDSFVGPEARARFNIRCF